MYLIEFDTCDEKAAGAARRSLFAYLERETGSGAFLEVETILSELLANVCQHAGRWAGIGIRWRRDGHPVLEVSDHGPGLDFSQWRPPPHFSEHGRGLFIVSRLSDGMDIAPGPDGYGTMVRAVLPLQRKPRAA
jgi:anti-sigma regulatory factor (Ser/Thr protein kinase)